LQEQIPDGRRPLGLDKFERCLALRIDPLHPYLHIGKGWDVFRNRIIERKFAGIDQHHRCEARDRFGHRMKREHCIQRHGKVGPDVAHAKGLQVNGVTMLLDQDDGAGEPSSRNLVFEEIGEELELFGGGRIGLSPAGRRATVHEKQHQANDQGRAPRIGETRMGGGRSATPTGITCIADLKSK